MQDYYEFINEPLPYSYKALSGYPFLQTFSLEQLLENLESMPEEVRKAIRNNAGGVYNHRFYFNGMTGQSTKRPGGTLAKAINQKYGSFEEFKKQFTDAAL